MYNVTCNVVRALSDSAKTALLKHGFSTKTKGGFSLIAFHPQLTTSHMKGQFRSCDDIVREGLARAFLSAVKSESLQKEIDGFVYVEEDSDDFDNYCNESKSFIIGPDGEALEVEALKKASLRETLSSHFSIPEGIDAFSEVGLNSVRSERDIIEEEEIKRCNELETQYKEMQYNKEKLEYEKLDEQTRIEKILDGSFSCDFVEKFYDNSRLKDLILNNLSIKRSLW